MIKRPTRTKLCERRRDMANFALKGWTQAAISRHMDIPQASVSRDLAAMREFWREFPVSDFEKVRLERLQKSDLMTCIAQSDDVGAPKGRFCARRECLVELDASRNWIEVYSGFLCNCQAREFSLTGIGLRDASVVTAGRSSERGMLSACSRGLKKYTQKRNERTLMRCRAGKRAG